MQHAVRYSVTTLASAVCLVLAACSGSDRTPARTPPLVLLISVDTLRADHLGAYGNTLGLTPSLDRLAEGGLVFESAWAPSSFTVPSISTILTGRYPEQNLILSNEHALANVETLASALKQRGYSTGAVVSNWVLRRSTNLNRGFDEYDDTFDDVEIQRGIPERVAKNTTDDALRTLDRLQAAPGHDFLWVHYQDPHGPYTPPPRLLEQYLGAELARPGGSRQIELLAGDDHSGIGGIPGYQQIGREQRQGYYRAAYQAEIRNMDLEVGRLLNGVRERGLLDEAVIVFVADHGESLGENDYWFAHGETLTEPLVHVPLILSLPDVPPGRRGDVVSLVDLFPTLVRAIGLEPDPDLPGRDLLAPDATATDSDVYQATLGAARFAKRFALIRGGKRIVGKLSPDLSYGIESYTSLADTDTDLRDTDAAGFEALKAALEGYRDRVKSDADAILQDMSPSDIELLKALGYVSGDQH